MISFNPHNSAHREYADDPHGNKEIECFPSGGALGPSGHLSPAINCCSSTLSGTPIT